MDYKKLAKAAIEAKARAYVPYSHFHVGAALLTETDDIVVGCNVESASYTPTICAERTALSRAVYEGHRKFKALAVAGSLDGRDANYCYPCGVCRQHLREFFTGDEKIIIAKTEDDYKVHTFAELMPYSFGPEDLNIASEK